MKKVICRHCDMVNEVPTMRSNSVAKCIRCERIISKGDSANPSVLFALSITALILIIPAFYFPLISVHLLGITEQTNLLQGAVRMLEQAPFVASVILFCAVIAPTLLMTSIAISSACFKFNYYPSYLPKMLTLTSAVKHWSMLEVYMISLMVSIFKLNNDADVFFDIGLYFFIALLLTNLIIIINYNNAAYWERYINV